MVAIAHPVTPTGFCVLTAMLRHRDHGIEGMNRYARAECARADKSTVHTLLRGFISAGWVIAFRSVDGETGVPHHLPAARICSQPGRAGGDRGWAMTTAYCEQEALASMLADDTPDPRPGRPAIVLYPRAAAQVLQELEVDRRSYGVMARRCRRTKPSGW